MLVWLLSYYNVLDICMMYYVHCLIDEIVQPLFIFSVKAVTLLHEKYGCKQLTFFIFNWNFLLTESTEAVCEA